MADETTTPGEGRDSPLYKLTQKVLTATEGHALIARADYLERKRVDKEAIVAANKAALEQARTDTFAKQQQGQEVMLSRDGQLQTHKGNKSLVTVAESIKKLETHKEEGKTDATSSDVGAVRSTSTIGDVLSASAILSGGNLKDHLLFFFPCVGKWFSVRICFNIEPLPPFLTNLL